MADIRHRVGVNAPEERVYEWLATREGLAEWWTRDVRGDAGQGGKLAFYFGSPEPSAVMEVVEAAPGRCVQWRCVEGPDEWVGTTVTFDLTSPNQRRARPSCCSPTPTGASRSSSCTTAAPGGRYFLLS